MTELIADCPRCGAQKTALTALNGVLYGKRDWQQRFEVFCLCRNCNRTSTYLLRQSEYGEGAHIATHGISKFSDSLNNHFTIDGYLSLRDEHGIDPPEHLPEDVETAFREGATCLAVQCWNAAGVMFRVCVDIATLGLLPPEGGEPAPNARQRRDLGLRLPWLFDHGFLSESLRELSSCIHQDGNDGAHQGTLGKEDAEDLLDFTEALLERLYTEPERLRMAAVRRAERRTAKE